MEHLLIQIAAAPNATTVEEIKLLVAYLRPAQPQATTQANHHLQQLNALLATHPDWALALAHALKQILSQYRQIHLYTDTGIFSSIGFSKSISQRLAWKVLPPVRTAHYLKDIFGDIFHVKTDYLWLQQLDPTLLNQLFDLLFGATPASPFTPDRQYHELLDALAVISLRVSALGLEPELIRSCPTIEEYDSPFLAQNRELIDFIEAYRVFIDSHNAPLDDRHLQVLLSQCLEIIAKIRKQTQQNGTSIDLTYLLHRLEQHIQRLQQLLALLDAEYGVRRNATITLLQTLVEADNTKLSLRHLLSQNVHLLSRQITDNASKTGEHYVCHSRSDFFAMLRSAIGAGCIVPLMAMLKILASAAKFAPFGQAFVYSLNYAFGFMLIHILHFTVATKQPAMTAANMAATIEQDNGSTTSLAALCELTITTIRSQFIAIVGNVAVAFPIAYLVGWFWHRQYGQHLVTPTKATFLLLELNPFTSLALFHAAIAGVCLFLAGLISGYYDNLAVYHRIGERLRQRKTLARLLGQPRLQRMTAYLENNLGALAGNFYFGVMLGSIGTLGFILGLPIDIRHITFSSANFAYAVIALEHRLDWQTWLVTLFGVLAIGVTNLAVSFSLALTVALKARGVRFRQWRVLLYLVWQQFLRRPRDFFWPPAKS